MDDGTIETHISKTGNKTYRLSLSTQSFADPESKEKILQFFNKKGCVFKYWNADYITFGKKSTHIILNEIKDYLIPIQGNRITKQFLNPSVKLGEFKCTDVTVTGIKQLNADYVHVYDIEVADNHNFYLESGVLVSNCQTPQEKTLGLARLFVAKARGQESGQMVLISQAYALGQFCMDSTVINDRYWTMLEQPSDGGESTTTTTQRPRFRPRNKDNDS